MSFRNEPRVLVLLLALTGAIIVPSASLAEFSTVTYPFCDDMEDTGSGNWTFEAPWGYTTASSHSGATSITDSPGALYQNSVHLTCSLASLDLSAADKPVLLYWERYFLEANADYGFIDVSGNAGASWTTVHFITGSQATWQEERVDLTDYRGLADVRIRFRIKTNASVRNDGWYIDDVCVEETATPLLPLPFADGMERGEDNWHSDSWALVYTERDGDSTHVWSDSPVGGGADSDFTEAYSLTLSGCIDLTDCVVESCSLFFKHRYQGFYFYVEASADGGDTWAELESFFNNSGTITPWIQQEYDLTPYLSPAFRLRFRSTNTNVAHDGWYIDDVAFDFQDPTDVFTETASGLLPSVPTLYPNAPNPFNASTSIRYALPSRASVTLRVYNVMGRLLRILLNGEQKEPGRYEVVWDARDDSGRRVVAGTYFYRLEIGHHRETRRMVIIR